MCSADIADSVCSADIAAGSAGIDSAGIAGFADIVDYIACSAGIAAGILASGFVCSTAGLVCSTAADSLEGIVAAFPLDSLDCMVAALLLGDWMGRSHRSAGSFRLGFG